MRIDASKLVVTSWVLVEPAEDVPGTWVSHCLDFDIISYGDSPKDAMDCVAEAVAMAVADDLNEGRDPSARVSAPEKFWDRLVHVLEHGTEVKLSEVSRPEVSRPSIIAAQITLAFQRVSRNHETAIDMTLNLPAPTGYIEQSAA